MAPLALSPCHKKGKLEKGQRGKEKWGKIGVQELMGIQGVSE